MKVKCTDCEKEFDMKYNKEEVEGATFDCPHCECVLTQQEGEILNLHKWINKSVWRIVFSGDNGSC